MQVVQNDRLKPCHDATFSPWLQRKRHNLLNSLPIDEDEDQDNESDDLVKVLSKV